MKLKKTPIAFAITTLFAAAAHAAPTVSFKTPAAGATLSGNIYQSSACEVAGSRIDKVKFYLNSTALNTEGNGPWQCNLDTRRFKDGSYTLKAVAYDSSGASKSTSIAVKIDNGDDADDADSAAGGATNTAPSVTITSPTEGATVTGTLNCAVTASDANGIQNVRFYLDGKWIVTDGTSPYTCTIDTTKLVKGTHKLRAQVRDKTGLETNKTVSFNVGTTSTNTPPTVSITSPATLSGKTAPYAADASDSGGSVAKVEFFLVKDGAQTALGTADTTAPYGGTFDSTTKANGTYTLMAKATDNLNATSTTQRSVTISNTVSNPEPTPDPDDPASGGSGTTLPSTNTKAVPTFESLGMYWKPGTSPGAAGCTVRYRKKSESAWKQGFPMWYDGRNAECRGSIVHLEPGTEYVVEMGIGTTWKAGVNTKTWADQFPVAKTVTVTNSSSTLKITQGGTKDGYVLYTGPATIDVANGAAHNIEISAPYVIVRGLTLKGAKNHGIKLLPGASDVVIEDNDISNWGSWSGKTLGGVQVGNERESAVYAMCSADNPWLQRTVIQRNKMHHPRYGANSWDYGHPLGPQAVAYNHCGGNHVMRYNDVYSTDGRYFKDGFGGQSNFSAIGFPNADSDIYGNVVKHAWDDGIEAEGANRNVRIWGNYIDQTAIGIATTVVHNGPLYMFRNVYNRSRMKADKALDNDDRQNFAKSGTASDFGDGRRYVFHNTLLQAKQDGVTNGLGAGGGIIAAGSTTPLTNTMSRNNILHVWKSSWDSIRTQGGGKNDLDYDLRNGGISAYSGAEANGWVGVPVYKSGHGWSNWDGGNYQLDASSQGFDKGIRLPNFNDGFGGSGPDVGAHESGSAPMKLGVSGAARTWK